MDNTVKKVAVIGCGRISVMHFDGIFAFGNKIKLVAVCDNKQERADYYANKYNVKVYYDYKQMLDYENLDAVHICLPHYLHCEVAEYAFNKGVHVLCEKPMDINFERAEHAVRLAKEKNVLYGIISQCRYNKAPLLVKKAVESGKLGKIISVRSTLTWSRSDEYYSGSDWKGTWDKEGGGVIIDQAIHSIDLVHWIVDSEPTEISCSMANRGHKIVKVEDSAEGLIKYANGVVYGFYAMNNYGCDEPIEIRFYCENGKAVFTYDDAYITYNNGDKEETHQVDVQTIEGGKDYWGFQHAKQISEFYKAVFGEKTLEISGEEALKTHKLIMDIYKEGMQAFKI